VTLWCLMCCCSETSTQLVGSLLDIEDGSHLLSPHTLVLDHPVVGLAVWLRWGVEAVGDLPGVLSHVLALDL
jgi:hypothetical protein